MKKNTLTFALSFAMIALVIAALFYVMPRSEPAASAQDTYPAFPTPTTLPTSVPGFIEQKLQPYAQSEISVQTVNGVEMAAANFRIEEGEFRADVCFQTPDSNDWVYYKVMAQIDDVELRLALFESFEMVQTSANGERRFITRIGNPPITSNQVISSGSFPDYRCDTLKFRPSLDNQTLQSDYVRLTVFAIGGTPNEGAGCATSEAMQSILDDKDLGIKIACAQTESGTKTEILEKPQSMSEEEARQHLDEAFQQMFVREGPWVFEGTVTTMP